MKLITGSQIRMARAYLKWSVDQLAEAAGVGSATIKRMETFDDIPRSARVETLEAVYKTLVHHLGAVGAELAPGNGAGPGVRRKKPIDE